MVRKSPRQSCQSGNWYADPSCNCQPFTRHSLASASHVSSCLVSPSHAVPMPLSDMLQTITFWSDLDNVLRSWPGLEPTMSGSRTFIPRLCCLPIHLGPLCINIVQAYFSDIRTSKELHIHMDVNKMMTNGIFITSDKHTVRTWTLQKGYWNSQWNEQNCHIS